MTCAYSATVCPTIFTMTGTSTDASHARSRATKASTPGFCSPIEFSMPDAVSAIRGVSLPAHGSNDTPFVTSAPSRDKSTKSAYSRPDANVPEAVRTGERSSSEPMRTLMSTVAPISASAVSRARPTGRRRRRRPGRRDTRARRPLTVAHTHERQAPIPHAMKRSSETWHGTPASTACAATMLDIASGPQA